MLRNSMLCCGAALASLRGYHKAVRALGAAGMAVFYLRKLRKRHPLRAHAQSLRRRQLCHIALSDFAKGFQLEPLIHANAIIVDKNDVGVYLDKVANLKAVITNNVLLINRKFKTPVSYQVCGLMVQCLNKYPRIRDTSDSSYRRQLFIPFDKCFTGRARKYIKDDYLNRKEVLKYVLFKVLNMDYYKFDEPEACKGMMADCKEYNNPVQSFVEDIIPETVWGFFIYIPVRPVQRVVRTEQPVREISRRQHIQKGNRRHGRSGQDTRLHAPVPQGKNAAQESH